MKAAKAKAKAKATRGSKGRRVKGSAGVLRARSAARRAEASRALREANETWRVLSDAEREAAQARAIDEAHRLTEIVLTVRLMPKWDPSFPSRDGDAEQSARALARVLSAFAITLGSKPVLVSVEMKETTRARTIPAEVLSGHGLSGKGVDDDDDDDVLRGEWTAP